MANGRMVRAVEYLTAEGVTRLNVYCETLVCRHRTAVQFARFKHKTPLQVIKNRLKCSVCGGRNIDVIPDWSSLQSTQHGPPG